MPDAIALPPPVHPNDPGIGPVILAVSWILTVLAIGAIGSRLYFRNHLNIKLASDDWTMLGATIFQIVYQIMLTITCAEGLGKRITDMTLDEIIAAEKWAYLTTPFSNVVSILARISITILLIRIFHTKTLFKWFLISFTALQTVLGVVNIIIIWAQCQPVEAVWDFRIVNEKCWDKRIQQYLSLVLQFLFGLSDLIYVFFPVLFIWKLHMPLRRKLVLMILLGFSILTSIAALSKVVVNLINRDVNPFTDPNIFTLFGVMSLCTAIEQCLVIIIGCVPTLRPLANAMAPYFNNIGSTLASLVQRGFRRSDSSKPASRSNKQSHYEDLEMNPTRSTSGEDLIRPTHETAAYTGPKPRPPFDQSASERTIDISVTYQNAKPLDSTGWHTASLGGKV